jgi:Fe-Mn family superoxide dismutase
MYSLPALPYDAESLQPALGADTVRTHHGKHHARYVRTVNELLGNDAVLRPLENVIADAHERGDKKLFNNAAQAWNHAFFWESMTPVTKAPAGALKDVIDAHYGSLTALRDLFVAEGAAHFGSGWAWLIASKGKVTVVSSHDADLPAPGIGTPLLVCDVWEHAYYLDYKNERDRFLRAWFDRLANWDFAARQYAAALEGTAGYRYPLPERSAGRAAAG